MCVVVWQILNTNSIVEGHKKVGIREFRDDIIDDMMAEAIRAKSPTERLAIAFNMWRSARRMIFANLQREHSDWTLEQLTAETAKRMSGGRT